MKHIRRSMGRVLLKLRSTSIFMVGDFNPEEIALTKHAGSLTKKFVELMQEYEETQGKYKSLLHERVERQVSLDFCLMVHDDSKVKVVNPNATEEEIKQAVESGGSDIFADRLLSKADQVTGSGPWWP